MCRASRASGAALTSVWVVTDVPHKAALANEADAAPETLELMLQDSTP